MEKKILSAMDIREAQDTKPVPVDVPEWGGVINVRPLTADEALTYAKYLKDLGNAEKQRHGAVRLLVVCAVNEEGAPLFTTEDIDWLSRKSIAPINRIQRVLMELNGFTETAKTEAKNA